ncbi:MAG TPA: hypothetical protein VFX49_11740 [Chloroflexota bacterium]|nr:hypothetical protein [Chloroflexota bacterium]
MIPGRLGAFIAAIGWLRIYSRLSWRATIAEAWRVSRSTDERYVGLACSARRNHHHHHQPAR